jgi:Zn-dependent protease with chaperone function/Zn-finger nucleic acid-binding protein
MAKNLARNFYEVQRKQWQKSLFLFLILVAFYFVAVGFVVFIVLAGLGLFLPSDSFPLINNTQTFIWISLGLALLIAVYHFYDARRFGADFIRKRLQAHPPEPEDRYHLQFANAVEEMRIASGLPKVNAFVIPAFAINSMALIESDNSPSIIVTEGLLADFTRDELAAVIAHELAHIVRGDTFYVMLVCSLANFFERLRQAAEPEEQAPVIQTHPGTDYRGGQFLVFLAASLSGFFMHLFSTLISREREILADAAAVEFSRNPAALARAIYKAHVKNSFVGDFNLTYSPLFIVPPESKGESDSLLSRIFNSHPPLMKRVKLLAAMVPATPATIIQEVLEIQSQRERARITLAAHSESDPQSPGISESPVDTDSGEGKIWSVCDSKGKWLGPFNLEEVLTLQFFTPKLRTRNLQEDVTAQAHEFPQIRTGLRKLYSQKPLNPSRHNRCPRCRTSLQDTFYEGVAIKACTECGGKLIDAGVMDRIITRKEVAFSDELQKKAQEFKDNFMWNPIHTMKIDMRNSPHIYCPNCGHKMLPRPYNYHYVVAVDKCLSCQKIWFDRDELEVLQILIEDR